MANMWLNSIRHCVDNLGRFDGRDRPGQFWPYAGTIFVVAIVTWFFAGSVAMRRLSATVAQSPNVSVSPSADVNSVFSIMIVVMAGIVLALILLLAAATIRRLHDGGRTGWWAMLPVFFFATGFLGMQFLRWGAGGGDFPSILVTALAINNIAYLVSLIVLIVFLAWTSEPRDNRYGPAAQH